SIEGTLVPLKPSSDLEAGAGWRRPGRELALYVAVLDAFNDLIYQDLEVLNAAADTALDYERQPVTLRGNLDLRLATRWRVEGQGNAGLTLGGFATYVRALTDRTPLPDGRALDDFRLTERTMQAGGLLLARVAPEWVIESWLARSWRPERKVYRNAAAPAADIDYQDVAWSGQAVLERRPEHGFTGGITYELDVRDVTRGAGEVPAREGSLARHNNEVRLEFGWRAANRWAFQLGLGLDSDPGMWPRG